MPGSLTHSAADIVSRLLVQLGLATVPGAGQSWPAHVSDEPDEPDDVITIYDTDPSYNGRTHTDGQVQQHEGIQIRIRAFDHDQGWAKANAIAQAVDTQVLRTEITIDGSTYRIQSITRKRGVLPIGKEYPASIRSLFVIHAHVSVREL